jgi:hypothetical protein
VLLLVLYAKIVTKWQVMADVNIDEAAKEEWDLIVLPGGMPGTPNFHETVSFQIHFQIHFLIMFHVAMV